MRGSPVTERELVTAVVGRLPSTPIGPGVLTDQLAVFQGGAVLVKALWAGKDQQAHFAVPEVLAGLRLVRVVHKMGSDVESGVLRLPHSHLDGALGSSAVVARVPARFALANVTAEGEGAAPRQRAQPAADVLPRALRHVMDQDRIPGVSCLRGTSGVPPSGGQ